MTTAKLQRVVVIGAGGHARVCVEALRDDASLELVGAVSSDGIGLPGLDVEVVGRDSELANLTESGRVTTGFVAVGDNAARARLANVCADLGLPLVRAVSRHAAVSTSADLADGVAVLPGAVVNAATSIGRCAIVNTNASVDHDCHIGDYVHVAPGVAIGGGVTVGDGSLVGIGATVLPGVSIGAHVTVGAGAVVIRDVPDGSVVVGNPAHPIGMGRP